MLQNSLLIRPKNNKKKKKLKGMQRKRKKEKNESSKIINKGNEKINFSFY